MAWTDNNIDTDAIDLSVTRKIVSLGWDLAAFMLQCCVDRDADWIFKFAVVRLARSIGGRPHVWTAHSLEKSIM
jgi:hypothetical protein